MFVLFGKYLFSNIYILILPEAIYQLVFPHPVCLSLSFMHVEAG